MEGYSAYWNVGVLAVLLRHTATSARLASWWGFYFWFYFTLEGIQCLNFCIKVLPARPAIHAQTTVHCAFLCLAFQLSVSFIHWLLFSDIHRVIQLKFFYWNSTFTSRNTIVDMYSCRPLVSARWSTTQHPQDRMQSFEGKALRRKAWLRWPTAFWRKRTSRGRGGQKSYLRRER